MNRRYLGGLCLLVVLAGGCSPRDHDNPLDPENSATGGTPQWLTALADDEAVDLSWLVPSYEDLDAVRLMDSLGGTVLWVGGTGRNQYRDAPLTNGIERSYRLVLVLNDGGLTELPLEEATPGSFIPWVYDVGRAEVVRLTPDGRRRRAGYFDSATLTVVADPDSGFVLAVDFFTGRILLLDRDANEIWREVSFERPNAGLRVPGGWWVTDSGLASVRLVDEAGVIRYENFDFDFPLDLAFAAGETVWVADAEGQVGRLAPGLGITASALLSGPRILASAPEGGVWVADREAAALVRLDALATETLRIPNFPIVDALAADAITGGVWVGDRGRRQVTLLDAFGVVQVTIPGFPAPSALSVSPDGAEIWVADPLLGDVVRLTRAGEELARSENLSSPVALSVAFR